ncbi:hypothetical protein SPURM210S_06598 [Streptomyces purpurascens]
MPLALQDRLIREGDRLTPDNPYDVRTLQGSRLKWLVDPAPGGPGPGGTGHPCRHAAVMEPRTQ